MIKHIVAWKLKDEAEGNKKCENAKIIKERLEALRNIITEIKNIEVGININDSSSAYDVVLYSEFETLNDLEKYQKHPEHVKIAEFIGKIREDRIVVDYEA
ncbi:Stress responsive A/B Barrel Domain [Caloramator quimbayensis]|uniref:Stress responsive A/B Barrel Domain n=1 Tax=Caloramator quimbayensis TaxID=1147123 RepID=A0A1T4XLT3_9CLOT|nr:Dabb family protein [Caloramator quimbayensis]SKA90466.1 Stress responsive A/B Barrel Domain [Caloramator quimbayensis]